MESAKPDYSALSRHKPGSPGVLPVLQALVSGDVCFDINEVESTTVDTALETGLGPILAYVTALSPTIQTSPHRDHIRAAGLTGRLLTADIFEAVEDVLAATNTLGCHPVLLKGCSTALRYYPEPYLRTMGDVDLLVSTEQLPALESQMRVLGFRQAAKKPASAYERHHHIMPFWHPQRCVWFEVHTRLYPRHSPLERDSRFSLDAMAGLLIPVAVGKHSARVMNHELQLVYTGTRWAEMLNLQRGVFPMLDAALLIRTQARTLDWDRVCAIVDGSWAATAVLLMLGYLDRSRLAPVPADVLRRLAASDRFTNRTLRSVLHRLIANFVIQGRPPGSILTRHNLRIIWLTLVRPKSAWAKLLALPMNITFPPRQESRFHLSEAIRRLRSVVRPARK